MHYTHLTQEQRYHIYALRKANYSLRYIAREVGCHCSTVSRELRRNRGKRGYRPQQAQRFAQVRTACNAYRITEQAWTAIEDKLKEDWSPEQIAGRLGLASHESIYQHIYKDKQHGGTLYRHLRCQKKRRKRYGSHSRRGIIKNRLSIDKRPYEINTRCRIGDWEADTIIGKGQQQALVSLVERRSGYTVLAKVTHKTAKAVSEAIVALLTPFKASHVHSITADNGSEFARHEQVSEALQSTFYFAHPYASWERGSNENTNGLVRQYFPKSKHFEEIEDEEVKTVIDKLNHRPRKRLGFKTPHEVFFEINVALQT